MSQLDESEFWGIVDNGIDAKGRAIVLCSKENESRIKSWVYSAGLVERLAVRVSQFVGDGEAIIIPRSGVIYGG